MQAYPRSPPYHDSYSYSPRRQVVTPPVAVHAPKPVQTCSLKADHHAMSMLLMNPRGAMPISVSKITTKQLPSSGSTSSPPGHAIHPAAGNHRPDEKQGLLAHQSQTNLDDTRIQKPNTTSTTLAGNANSSRGPSSTIYPMDGGPYYTNHNHPLRLMPHQPPEISEEAIIFQAIRMRDEADARHYQKEKLEQQEAAKKKRVQVLGTKETLQSHVPSVKKEGEFIAPRNNSNSKSVRGNDMARPEQKDPLLDPSRGGQLQGPGRKPPYYHSHHGQRREASHQSNVPEEPNRIAGQSPHQLLEPQSYHKDAYIFATPPEFEAVDEKEKERRHQSLAVEQQDLILQRVRASRAKKVGRRHQKPTQARRTT
jgi:hypothetical protein